MQQHGSGRRVASCGPTFLSLSNKEVEMTRHILSLATVALLASSISLAHAQQPSDDRPMPQRDRPGQGMMGSDRGANPDMMRMMQGRAGDQQERMEAGPRMMRHGGMMGHDGMMRIMFAIMDADGDGALTLSEVQDTHARIYKHIDADKNGKVTPQEMQEFFRGPGPASGFTGR